MLADICPVDPKLEADYNPLIFRAILNSSKKAAN
jgi:hypothetical protein